MHSLGGGGVGYVICGENTSILTAGLGVPEPRPQPPSLAPAPFPSCHPWARTRHPPRTGRRFLPHLPRCTKPMRHCGLSLPHSRCPPLARSRHLSAEPPASPRASLQARSFLSLNPDPTLSRPRGVPSTIPMKTRPRHGSQVQAAPPAPSRSGPSFVASPPRVRLPGRALPLRPAPSYLPGSTLDMAALGTSLPLRAAGASLHAAGRAPGSHPPPPRLTADRACPLTEQLTVMQAT